MQKLVALAAVPALYLIFAAPARADSVSFSAGPSFAFQSAARAVGGTTQLNFGASFDLGPAKSFPIKTSLVFDYAGGSAGGGSLASYGAGVGLRFNAPVYAGINGLLYNVSVNPGGGAATASRTGFGTNYFVGERLVEMPGGGSLSLQATYRQVPTVNGVNPSGVAVTLRLGL